jgi:thimet oligopeptidase
MGPLFPPPVAAVAPAPNFWHDGVFDGRFLIDLPFSEEETLKNPTNNRHGVAFPVLLALALTLGLATHAQASRTAPLIDYKTVTQEVVEAECQKAVEDCDVILAEMVAVPNSERTFENTMIPLHQIGDLLGITFGKYAFLGYVSTDEELRDVARAQEEAMDKYVVDLGFREDIYQGVKAYSKSKEAKRLEGEHARFLEFTLRDYRRNGFEETKKTRDAVKALQNRLVELSVEFEKNLAEWKDGIEVSPDRTGGLPASYLGGLQTKENGNYWVSLDYPDLFPFLQNANDSDLRRELLAKSWNEGYPQNVELLEEAISLRHQIAELLGYPSWAHYVLEVRMAKNPENVLSFLDDLQVKIRPKLQADIAKMQRDYGSQDADGIDYWDWRYYNTQQMLNEYNVDQNKVSEYFPLNRVLDGMFDITQEMFGLRYEEVKSPDVWHEDIQLFEIYDSSTGEFIAHFYTDLFPREGKFGHAAAFPLRNGSLDERGERQTPVSAIVANFTKPTKDTPSLLTHDEVETMFHEFGHILHQTLTRAELSRFAGTATEQDFVEAPSQNLEHWIWEPEVLDRFAAHYETGETIPRSMVDGMIAAKQLNSGIRWQRQVFYATLDMKYHGPGDKKNTTTILNDLHAICGFDNLQDTHFQAGFGHLFGYDAAYYGYLWSKVYGDDMYTAFEEAGILNPKVGMKYRVEIYEKGGTLDGEDLVRNFLGREPNNKAFLEDLGLSVN